MGKREDLILARSGRGMELLRTHLSGHFCDDAARAIAGWPRGTVLLTTGFYVAGHAETDGPTGTLFLAWALHRLGFAPVVVTDEPCRGYFERFSIPVRYFEGSGDELLRELSPVGLISVERCGENIRGDYANMRGVSIAAHTRPIDRLFAGAHLPTVGIGDGGNEIGMGNLAEVIEEKLSLVPCRVRVEHLLIATVSNWGALGLCAALGWLPEREDYLRAYETARELGFVDGVTGKTTLSEDGFPLEIGLELLSALQKTI